jgi:hypothetical protein
MDFQEWNQMATPIRYINNVYKLETFPLTHMTISIKKNEMSLG